MTRSIFAVILLVFRTAQGQQPPPATPLAFEVVSIRPHLGPMQIEMGFSSSGPHLNLKGYTNRLLVMEAYGLKGYQVSWASGAGSEDDVFYDINAKAEGDASRTKSEFRRMLQILLVQRFSLTFHLESREMPVYALTVSKSGRKFKESAADASEAVLVGVHGRNQTIATSRESLESLADQIPNVFIVDRPVVDRTSLTGTYDIKLEATPEFRIQHNPEPDDISIFTAVQSQLGLKLEPSRAKMRILVIDHIEKPSEN